MEKDNADPAAKDTSDLFKDFKFPEKEKGKNPYSQQIKDDDPVEQVSEEEKVKRKYQKAEQLLQEKYSKEIRRAKGNKLPNYERFGYIAIILILIAYIGIDFGFYHKNSDGELQTSVIEAPINLETADIVAEAASSNGTAVNETKKETLNESQIEEKDDTGEKAEEKKLSGVVSLSIEKIYSQKVGNDTGQISKIDFTIDNGKDKSLMPVVDVYAFDTVLDKSWETKSRGRYKGSAIEPGSKYSGSISLVPKTFSNLKVEKSVRLVLNDTKEGFMAAANEMVTIS